jgi:hypothetical protein
MSFGISAISVFDAMEDYVMNTRRTQVLGLVGCVLFWTSTVADEPPVCEHLKDLEAFIGVWEGQTVFPESEDYSESGSRWQGMPLQLRLDIKWAPGRGAQIEQSVFEVPGEVRILATTLRGWDQATGKVIGTRFTTHKGIWTETWEKRGDVWVTEYSGLNLDGAQCKGIQTTAFPDADTMVIADTNQTVDGRPVPDSTVHFQRVPATPSHPSHYEHLKGLEFMVGEWRANTDDGGSMHWVVAWTADRNALQNVLTGKDAHGEITFSNKGYFGWDPQYRRITNWCVDAQGNRPTFLWEQQPDGTWESWAPGGSSRGIVTVMDDGTWCIDGGSQKIHFKPVAE